jgi:hypothetical protein
VELDELISAIQSLVDNGLRIAEIERAVNMPKNYLSGMLKQTRPFPEKWQRKLTVYVRAKAAESQATLALAAQVSPIVPDLPPSPNTQKEIAVPKGLSKSEQLRWHRENSQTLK